MNVKTITMLIVEKANSPGQEKYKTALVQFARFQVENTKGGKNHDCKRWS